MVKIKLTRQQIQSLICAMVGWDATMTIVQLSDDHLQLLLELQHDITMHLGKCRQRNSRYSTVKFSSLYARAFMQMWLSFQLPIFPDEQAVIILVIGILDKANKQPKKVLEYDPEYNTGD